MISSSAWRNFAAVVALLCATGAWAETMGIRFAVGDDLGRNAAQQQATRAALEKYVTELNGYYRASGVALDAEIVQVEFVRIETTDDMRILGDMAHERDGFADMFRRADEFGADYTVAIAGNLVTLGKPGCGRAFVENRTVAEVSSTRRAFAVVNFVCGAHTLAHELGHLMGLNHGALIAKCRHAPTEMLAIAPYANGYGEGNCDGKPQPGEFGDIMVGGGMREVNGADKSSLRLFSNPRIHDERCGKNKTCGDPVIGDAARALNENAHYYASHEEPDVHTLHYGSAGLRDCIDRKYHGTEIADLHELACPNAGIGDLAGMERLSELRRIDLSGNSIEDVSPLDKLSPGLVEKIDLSGNGRISCLSMERLAARYRGKVIRPESCRP